MKERNPGTHSPAFAAAAANVIVVAVIIRESRVEADASELSVCLGEEQRQHNCCCNQESRLFTSLF
jgi:hypothetical protein